MKTFETHISKLFIVIFSFFAFSSANALIVVDGIIQSGDFFNPLDVDFEEGSNNLAFLTDTFTFGPDVIRVTVEAGETLDAFQLINFQAVENSDNRAFLGILDATTFDPNSLGADLFPTDPSLLLTGLLFGEGDAGQDLLEVSGSNNNAGFTLPIGGLTEGEYLIWFNETAGLDLFSIDFQLTVADDTAVVPVPAALYLMMLPLIGLLGIKKKA